MGIGLGAISSALGSVGSAVGSAGLSTLSSAAGGYLSAKNQYNFSKKEAIHRPSWEVEGLKRAGLNPILAATGGWKGSSSGVSGFSVSPVDIASSAEKLSSSGQKGQFAQLAKQQIETSRAQQEMFEKQAAKAHWEASSASVQAYKDRLLAKAYDSPLVQKSAPYLRAYAESGLPASSAFQLMGNLFRPFSWFGK